MTNIIVCMLRHHANVVDKQINNFEFPHWPNVIFLSILCDLLYAIFDFSYMNMQVFVGAVA